MKIIYCFIIVLLIVSCILYDNYRELIAGGSTVNQLLWKAIEKDFFIHFTTNTFTGLEWCYGNENHSILNITEPYTEKLINTVQMNI